MKILLKIIAICITTITILACNSNFTATKQSIYRLNKQHKPVKVIFDTDMGPDYDDIGAIAVLHALADSNELEILATVSSNAHPDISPTIEVLYRYFGRPNIPIGDASSSALNFTASNNWNNKLIEQFYQASKGKKYESAVTVYRKILANQPDNSVTILTVGFMSNISDLLKSSPDSISKMNGLELVNHKVKNWVAMTGIFPDGREFNVYEDSTASVYAFNNFPKPILLSGFEIGDKIKTGAKVAAINDSLSPISVGYRYNFATYAKEGEKQRSSWDQTAVLVAARDPEKYFYLSGPGKFIVQSNGLNYWLPSEGGKHRFLIHKYPSAEIAKVIDDLMLHKPINR